jgi:hypothetical protein
VTPLYVIIGATAPLMVTCAPVAVAVKAPAHQELKCLHSPGLGPAETLPMVEITSFPTMIAAVRVIAAGACAIVTRVTNLFTDLRQTMILIGAWVQKPISIIVQRPLF